VVQVPDDIKDSIPAIVHVDGTARVQTVDKNEAPGYWKLINKFYKITNVPVVLNTSFNVGGKPIVETPKDAVDCYESTNIDLLLLEDWILSKRPIEEYIEVSR
jgi:carbamoyltransferase